MSTKKPKISIIVPAYNEEKYIKKCLDALLNQNIKKNLYEVIVVDNASSDKTAETVRKYPVKLIYEKRKGVAYARSAGTKVAQGEIIAFTDADCTPDTDWISKFLKKFRQDPKIDAIGGVFAFYDGNKFLKTLALKTQRFTWHLSGGNMAIRKKSLAKIGGFEAGVNAGEDVLITLKLQKQGQYLIDQNNIMPTSSRRLQKNFLKTVVTWFPNDFALKYLNRPLFSYFPDIR